MFENLSDREKKLLLGVGVLVPISLLFLLVFWWIGAIDDNNRTLTGLDRQIAEQNDLQFQGKLAQRRKNYYGHISLPKSINDASNDYQRWLKSALADADLKFDSITPRDGETIRSGNQWIGRGKVMVILAVGRLENINDFLAAFYSLDLMHRINSLTMVPIDEKSGNRTVRSGLLKVNMTIEIMALKTGKQREDFSELVQKLDGNEDRYAEILHRNIFGPANNQPLLDGSTNKTVTQGVDISFSVAGKDADKQDLLSFELVESSVAEAKIQQRRPSDRRVQFTMPDQKPGKYEFTIKISDNGYPSKSVLQPISVTVREKAKPAVTKKSEPKPDPELDSIRLVRVRGISQGADGVERAWMDVPRLGGTLKLAVNESFALDKKEYSVVSINKNQVQISGDDKTFVGRLDFKTNGRLVESK